MDPAAGHSMITILDIATNLGLPGVVMMFWYFDKKQIDKALERYREDMLEQRKMYENNVELVRRYIELASDLKDVVTLNTQTMTRLIDRACKER